MKELQEARGRVSPRGSIRAQLLLPKSPGQRAGREGIGLGAEKQCPALEK